MVVFFFSELQWDSFSALELHDWHTLVHKLLYQNNRTAASVRTLFSAALYFTVFFLKYYYFQIRVALNYDITWYAITLFSSSAWFLNLYGALQPTLYFALHTCFHLASLSLIVFISNCELVLIKRLLTSAHSVASLWGTFLSFISRLFSESPFCSFCCPFCWLNTVRFSAVADEIMRETRRRLWSGF